MVEVNEKIRVLYKEVGELSKTKIIDNSIEAIKELLGENLKEQKYGEFYIINNNSNKGVNSIANISIDSLQNINGNFVMVAKENNTDIYRSLTKDECIKYAYIFNEKSFKHKEIKNTKKQKMKINWQKIKDAKPEEKLKNYKSTEPIQEETEKISSEEMAKRVDTMFNKIKNDPRLTEEQKSEEIQKMFEKLKKIPEMKIIEIDDKEFNLSKESSAGTDNNNNRDNNKPESKITNNKSEYNERPVFDANEVLKMILTMQSVILKFIKENTVEED